MQHNRRIVSRLILTGFFFVLGLGCAVLLIGLVAHQAQAMPAMPTWKQVNVDGFGSIENQQIPSLAAFNDYLYAGVFHYNGITNTAQIWRSSTGENWDMVDEFPAVGAAAMTAFDGSIYVGSWDGFVWSSTNGITWTEIITDGFDGTDQGIARFAVFDKMLYASTWNSETQIWRTGNGIGWEPFVGDGLGDPNNIGAISSEIFNGQLYWGVMNSVTGGQLWRTDGITTSAVITDGFGNPENWVISSLAVFGDALYAGVINNPVVQDEEVQVWRSADGVRWEQVVNGFGIPRYGAVNGLEEINGLLYLMVENDLTGLEVWRTGNGMDWVQVGFDGFGDVNNQWSYWDNAMVVFKEKLYIGTNNYVTGGEVWQMTPETVPPAVVTLNGASEGFAGQTYQFTATVEPISTSLPLTYTWQASGQAPVIHTGGLMDTASFTWEAPGTQGITVTASNQGGEVIGNHTIEISRMTFRIFMPIALRACLPIYSDNFSDPASGWPVGESSETTYAYLNGEYQVLIKPAGVTHGAIIDLGVSDFQFELDARGVSNLDGSVGLIFNWTDANQYYLFEVSDGWFSLWLRDPQNWTPLIHWTYNSAIHPGLEWNHLEVVRAGSSITLFANDQNLGKVNDSTYFGTWLGLASASYTLPNFDSRYDNFVVYSGCTGSHAASACISPTLSMTDVWMVDGSGKPGR